MSKKSIETSCSYTDETMWVSTDEKWLINRIRRLAEKNPGQVTAIKEPEENDGCLYCRLPSNWLRIQPPNKPQFTPEQRAALSERMKNIVAATMKQRNESEET